MLTIQRIRERFSKKVTIMCRFCGDIRHVHINQELNCDICNLPHTPENDLSFFRVIPQSLQGQNTKLIWWMFSALETLATLDMVISTEQRRECFELNRLLRESPFGTYLEFEEWWRS